MIPMMVWRDVSLCFAVLRCFASRHVALRRGVRHVPACRACAVACRTMSCCAQPLGGGLGGWIYDRCNGADDSAPYTAAIKGRPGGVILLTVTSIPKIGPSGDDWALQVAAPLGERPGRVDLVDTCANSYDWALQVAAPLGERPGRILLTVE